MESEALPEPRVVLVDYLPDDVPAMVQDDPPEIFVNRQLWRQMSPREQESLIAHERGHLDTATFQVPGVPIAPSTLLRHEAHADRAGLRRLIPDERVWAAIHNECRAVHEFAEFWGVDEVTAHQRLYVFSPNAFPR